MVNRNANRIALVHDAGDPNDALPLRIDVVAAAMKVLEVHEKRKGLTDWQWSDNIDEALEALVRKCRRYRKACRARSTSIKDSKQGE